MTITKKNILNIIRDAEKDGISKNALIKCFSGPSLRPNVEITKPSHMARINKILFGLKKKERVSEDGSGVLFAWN